MGTATSSPKRKNLRISRKFSLLGFSIVATVIWFAGKPVPTLTRSSWGRLLHRQHIASAFDRLVDLALLLGRQTSHFARKDLACLGDITAHDMSMGEVQLLWSEASVYLFVNHRKGEK